MKAFEKNIRKVEPYVPGEQPQHKVIKLNTNENPYPPAPGVTRALEEMDTDRLRLYPDPTAGPLVEELARFYHVNPDQVFVGVGSDDVLSMCFLTFFNSEKPIYFPDITYSFYKVWADLYRIPYECQKLDENFRIVKEDYYKENGGVIFPNPNAPTAIYEELDVVEDIIAHNQDVIVIVDEAYVDFAGRSVLELIDKYENLIVVQTFSKARSMAGMRIGYAISNPMLIKYLNDAKYSFNSYTMNQTSLICGVEAVKDRAYFEAAVHKIIETREWAKGELAKLGFHYLDSSANFIFAMHPKYDAKELFEALKANNIYVRYWGSERIEQYMRITIGTREEMEALFDFLRKYMNR
ncbi:histidinol-phosphate transaminase [Bariatricus sp. SGI.154]|uniref:histidinol-phosphate transaminase n=1 Tax=Bariatricus sp. SGI.154 TaxID=3420549 RepID=UPI003CFE50C9